LKNILPCVTFFALYPTYISDGITLNLGTLNP
jgi:hypothetical protein